MTFEMPDIPDFLDRRKGVMPREQLAAPHGAGTAEHKTQPPVIQPGAIKWSFTILNTYKNICPHQAYRRYIKRDIPYSETPAIAKGNAIHKALELRVGSNTRLPDDMASYEQFARVFDGKQAKAELQLGVTTQGQPCGFFDPQVWGRGKLDVVLVNREVAYLADWKSGKVREDPLELEVQAVLLHVKYPQLKKIVGQYVWLAEHRLGQQYDLSDTRATWELIGRTVESMELDRARGVFEKRQGPLCGWCPVKDCENNRT